MLVLKLTYNFLRCTTESYNTCRNCWVYPNFSRHRPVSNNQELKETPSYSLLLELFCLTASYKEIRTHKGMQKRLTPYAILHCNLSLFPAWITIPAYQDC